MHLLHRMLNSVLLCSLSSLPSHSSYYTTSPCAGGLPTPIHLFPHGKGGLRRRGWGNRWSLLSSWQPTVSHIRQLSDIIWLAMPGLWKEAHAVLSERQQQQEREQATGRDSEVRRECFFFFLLNRLSGAR